VSTKTGDPFNFRTILSSLFPSLALLYALAYHGLTEITTAIVPRHINMVFMNEYRLMGRKTSQTRTS
jgi:hypothetical protein